MVLGAFFERRPWDQLHRDDRDPLDLLGAKDIDAVGMTDLGRQSAFAQEPLAVLRRAHLLRQDLQRNRPSRVLVPGLIDFAHAAFAQEPDNQVVAERLTG